MKTLYLASWTEGAGKTSLCVGIGRWLQKNGRKVGYVKPVALTDTGDHKDAEFLKQTLGLDESAEALSPLLLDRDALKSEVTSGSLATKVKQSCASLAKGKDTLLVEAVGGLDRDDEPALASYHVAEALDAGVVVVVAWQTGLSWDDMASSAGRFGQRLLGIVVNRVPESRLASVRSDVTPGLQKNGIRVLGVLPEDRLLMGIAVAEIAERLQADVLCCPESSGNLVYNLMIGAMTVDSGADYFNRLDSKAVITRGERPDTQLAALATSTGCLVLTGGVQPIPQVLSWAEDKSVPVLLTSQDTLSTVADVEQTFLQTRFRQSGKIDRLDRILKRELDFPSLALLD